MRREVKAQARAKQNKTKRNVIIIVTVLALLCGSAFAVLHFTKKEEKKPEPVKEAKLINPLTGLEVKKLQSRPMMLSTDNDSYLSRPQSGISQADIVYEVPIEGGGSRFEMIFYSKIPGKIGPARSARPYIVDIAREYQAIFVHNGWSQAAKAYLETGVVADIPAAYNWKYFYRSDDRNIPHNCYTEGKDVWKCAKEKGFDVKKEIEAFDFYKDKDQVTGKKATKINVDYVAAKNTYVYNEKTKKYDRFTGGSEFIDKETGKQIAVSNVIVQNVNIAVLDNEGRLKIDLTEGGKGTLFTRGKAIPITWSREDLDGRTVYKDKNGEVIKLSKGQTYFQLVDYTVKVNYS